MLKTIAQEIQQKGGRSFYTGGYVRDFIINGNFTETNDIDVEVFHLEQELLVKLLKKYGQVKIVGKIYPVFKIAGHPQWDFSVASYDHYNDAVNRRDFTVNALMIDILTGEILDYGGGKEDISRQVIRHMTKEVFVDDPLRAYRAAGLAARFNFTIHPETQKLMKAADLSKVPAERIYGELKKLLMLSPKPSIGLKYLQETGLLEQLHPQLYQMIGCPQEPTHHPEGDVWEHTLLVTDEAAKLKDRAKNPLALMLAALLHDIGKPGTTEERKGKITSYGHDTVGAKMAADFLQNLLCSKALINSVSLLVREHMHPVLLYKQKEKVTDKAIRKLTNRVDLSELLLLSEADFKGRNVDRDYTGIRQWFLDKAAALGLKPGEKIEPLVKGRDLQELGLIPGRHFKMILDRAFEMQLEGKGKDEILKTIKADY